MTRRQHLLDVLHQALRTTIPQGINVRKTFVMSQQQNYPRPFAKAEIMAESFEYDRDESNGALLDNYGGVVQFGVYAGVKTQVQDTSDNALLEAECERVIDILHEALHNYDYPDAVLDNGARLLIQSVYVTGLVPAILDNEMTGNILLEGVIEYSHYTS
jgi:hypothetical protein